MSRQKPKANTPDYKVCPDCRREHGYDVLLFWTNFYSNKARNDGLGAYCKQHTNDRYRGIRVAYKLRKRAAIREPIYWLDLYRLFDVYNNQCLRCGKKEDLCFDHIIPLARGGVHSLYNLQPLCRSCNSWKGTKTIDFRLLIE